MSKIERIHKKQKTRWEEWLRQKVRAISVEDNWPKEPLCKRRRQLLKIIKQMS